MFDVAVGERSISHTGHIDMMAAAQPFLSGAISKTVNLPETASVEDIADAYTDGWSKGLKALAIYRDGSKTAQALKTDAGDKKGDAAESGIVEIPRERKKMPRERESITHKFSIGMQEGYITAGKYEDGSLGEIFLTDIGKEGSTIKGLMNAFATAISIGLQYGVPLEDFVKKFSYMRFEPEGITRNPEIPFAKSLPDYIMRWLASRFIEDVDYLEQLGIMTDEVRARKDAQLALPTGDTNGGGESKPANGEGNGNGHRNGHANGEAKATEAGGDAGGSDNPGAAAKPATSALTDTPPVIPAKMGADLELGPACDQCGGMMQRTGSCYTCSLVRQQHRLRLSVPSAITPGLPVGRLLPDQLHGLAGGVRRAVLRGELHLELEHPLALSGELLAGLSGRLQRQGQLLGSLRRGGYALQSRSR